MFFCEFCQLFNNAFFTEHLHNKIYQERFYYNLKVIKIFTKVLKEDGP